MLKAYTWTNKTCHVVNVNICKYVEVLVVLLFVWVFIYIFIYLFIYLFLFILFFLERGQESGRGVAGGGDDINFSSEDFTIYVGIKCMKTKKKVDSHLSWIYDHITFTFTTHTTQDEI